MESEELRELVERTYELTRKNNKMIRRMRRASMFGSLIKIIMWGGMLFISYWSYVQYVQPMLGSLDEVLQKVNQAKDLINNAPKSGAVPSMTDIQNLKDKLPPGFLDALHMIQQNAPSGK